MYVDQDKGWTLLNRGTVIGKIKFSIEELLAGLNGFDLDDLIEKKTTLELNRDKYLAMLNIQELSEQVYEQNGEIFISDIEKELNEKIAYCNIKLENEKNALKERTKRIIALNSPNYLVLFVLLLLRFYNSQKFRSYHSKLIETKSTFVYPSLHISIQSFIFNKTPLRDIFSRMLYGNLYFRREAKGLPFLHPINQALDTM